MKSLLNFKKRVSMLSDCCHDKSGYMGTSREVKQVFFSSSSKVDSIIVAQIWFLGLVHAYDFKPK